MTYDQLSKCGLKIEKWLLEVHATLDSYQKNYEGLWGWTHPSQPGSTPDHFVLLLSCKWLVSTKDNTGWITCNTKWENKILIADTAKL